MQMKLTQSLEIQVKEIPAHIRLFCQLATIQKLISLIQNGHDQSGLKFDLLLQILGSDSASTVYEDSASFG